MNPATAPKPPDVKPIPGGLVMEFCKRALSAASLDTLYFLLSNDLRTLVHFERCFVITHLGAKSNLVAINNQPLMDKRAKLYGQTVELAKGIRLMNKGLLLPNDPGAQSLTDSLQDQELVKVVREFMAETNSAYIAFIPLTYGERVVGHLVMEFFENNPPERTMIDGLIGLGPIFGAALTQKWILRKNPELKRFIQTDPKEGVVRFFKQARYAVPLALLLAGLVLLLFFIPIADTVGGEALIFPREKHIAFSKIDGIIDEVLAKEGDSVEVDQVVAKLDPKELNYKIAKSQADFDVLTEQLLVLRASAGDEVARLAESRLVELKRKNAWLDLTYHKWQRQFLDIKTPVAGIVTTKEVETLKGKKVQAGEAFCEIAVPEDLWVEVYVPEEKVSNVLRGQRLRLYLNKNPLQAIELRVGEVTPAAEVHERIGNVYRVLAPLGAESDFALLGMKGIGKIDTYERTIWNMFVVRVAKFWNRVSLHF